MAQAHKPIVPAPQKTILTEYYPNMNILFSNKEPSPRYECGTMKLELLRRLPPGSIKK